MEDPGPASLEAPPIATRAASITRALGGAMGDASTAGDSATGGAKAAASRATEDMHTLIRALKTDLSCMSVRLERLEALLSA